MDTSHKGRDREIKVPVTVIVAYVDAARVGILSDRIVMTIDEPACAVIEQDRDVAFAKVSGQSGEAHYVRLAVSVEISKTEVSGVGPDGIIHRRSECAITIVFATDIFIAPSTELNAGPSPSPSPS